MTRACVGHTHIYVKFSRSPLPHHRMQRRQNATKTALHTVFVESAAASKGAASTDSAAQQWCFKAAIDLSLQRRMAWSDPNEKKATAELTTQKTC